MSKLSKMQENGHLKIGEVVPLSTGVNVKISYVPVMLVEQAQQMIDDPQVPFIPGDDGVERENPMHPDYLVAVAKTERQRAQSAIDTIIMFCLELADGLPEDDIWIKKIKFLEKKGHIDLSDIDWEDDLDVTFAYLKYIAIGNNDMLLIGQLAGLSGEDITKAEKSFQRETTRGRNKTTSVKKPR